MTESRCALELPSVIDLNKTTRVVTGRIQASPEHRVYSHDVILHTPASKGRAAAEGGRGQTEFENLGE